MESQNIVFFDSNHVFLNCHWLLSASVTTVMQASLTSSCIRHKLNLCLLACQLCVDWVMWRRVSEWLIFSVPILDADVMDLKAHRIQDQQDLQWCCCLYGKVKENTPEDKMQALDNKMAPILSDFFVFRIKCFTKSSRDQETSEIAMGSWFGSLKPIKVWRPTLWVCYQGFELEMKLISNLMLQGVQTNLHTFSHWIFYESIQICFYTLYLAWIKDPLVPIVISEQETFHVSISLHKSKAQHWHLIIWFPKTSDWLFGYC